MSWMNHVFASVMSMVLCVSVAEAAQKQEDAAKKLTLARAGRTAGAAELQLLPQAQEWTDADAFPLYAKAIQSVPEELDRNKINAWRQVPVSQLPQAEVEPLLRQFDAIFPLLEQAARCKRCDWSLSAEGDASLDLSACRNMAFLLALKARSQLAGGDYASCVQALGAGLALAKHLNAGPTAIHVLVGVAIGAVVYGEIEQYMQQAGAPSLEAAIRAIPKPLFDEKHSDLYGMDAASRSRIQLLLGRANRHVIVLQYVETLRVHATRAGKLPQTLDELKANLPNDPVAGKPFSYRRLSDTQAILEGPLPEGGGVKDAVQYELTLGK
ncbi:MAG: hypothetical protein JW955_16215 [Sedimentisphaerales bacterium]|nr:hypothetical protein [Sedimentisphaerales bacterium]